MLMPEPPTKIDGVRVPPFLYGTAWKEAETQRLTELALRSGFRGIDTANQRRHYYEAAVGRGIAASIAGGVVARDELFIQTKFTFRAGQDHRLPYDPGAHVGEQVEQSFASSLEHLGVERVESYVLHGPSTRSGLADDDWDAWRAMESIHDSGQARLLGVSNVSLAQLQALCRKARVQPRFVQNRCYAVQAWDRDIRTFCNTSGIVYQGFSLLTANRHVLSHPAIVKVAKRYGRTASQVIFRFALDIGILPLTGTSSAEHMQQDLDVRDIRLEDEEVNTIEQAGES
jgi:diketogulonate reductase-like aldo/keto reductase